MATEQASTAQRAYGFTLYRHNGSTFVEVKNVRVPAPSNIDNEEVKKTHHGSPRRNHEFGLTIGEHPPSDFQIDFDQDDATHVAIYADCEDKVETTQYKLNFPDDVISCSGIAYIRNWKWGSMEVGNLRQATFTLRESPAWDWLTAMS